MFRASNNIFVAEEDGLGAVRRQEQLLLLSTHSQISDLGASATTPPPHSGKMERVVRTPLLNSCRPKSHRRKRRAQSARPRKKRNKNMTEKEELDAILRRARVALNIQDDDGKLPLVHTTPAKRAQWNHSLRPGTAPSRLSGNDVMLSPMRTLSFSSGAEGEGEREMHSSDAPYTTLQYWDLVNLKATRPISPPPKSFRECKDGTGEAHPLERISRDCARLQAVVLGGFGYKHKSLSAVGRQQETWQAIQSATSCYRPESKALTKDDLEVSKGCSYFLPIRDLSSFVFDRLAWRHERARIAKYASERSPYGADPQLMRSYHSSIAYRGRAYIFGGKRNSSSSGTSALTALNDVWVLYRKERPQKIDLSPKLKQTEKMKGHFPAIESPTSLGLVSSPKKGALVWQCDEVRTKGAKPARRWGHCAFRLRHMMYIVGGQTIMNKRVEAKQRLPGVIRRRKGGAAVFDMKTHEWKSIEVAYRAGTRNMINMHGHSATPCWHPECGSFMCAVVVGGIVHEGLPPITEPWNCVQMLHSPMDGKMICEQLECALENDDPANAPNHRTGHAAACFGMSNVIIFGGKTVEEDSSETAYLNDVCVLEVTPSSDSKGVSGTWRCVTVEGEAPTPREHATLTLVWEQRGEALLMLHGGWGHPNSSKQVRVPWSGDTFMCHVRYSAESASVVWRKADNGVSSNPWLRYGHTTFVEPSSLLLSSKIRAAYSLSVLGEHSVCSICPPNRRNPSVPVHSGKMPEYEVTVGEDVRISIRITDTRGNPLICATNVSVLASIAMFFIEGETSSSSTEEEKSIENVHGCNYDFDLCFERAGHCMVKLFAADRLLKDAPFRIAVKAAAPVWEKCGVEIGHDGLGMALSLPVYASPSQQCMAGSTVPLRVELRDEYGNDASMHPDVSSLRAQVLPFHIPADCIASNITIEELRAIACDQVVSKLDEWFPKWLANGGNENLLHVDAWSRASSLANKCLARQRDVDGASLDVLLSSTMQHALIRIAKSDDGSVACVCLDVRALLGFDGVLGESAPKFEAAPSEGSVHAAISMPTTSGYRAIVSYFAADIGKNGLWKYDGDGARDSFKAQFSIVRVRPAAPDPQKCEAEMIEMEGSEFECGSFLKFSVTLRDEYGNKNTEGVSLENCEPLVQCALVCNVRASPAPATDEEKQLVALLSPSKPFHANVFIGTDVLHVRARGYADGDHALQISLSGHMLWENSITLRPSSHVMRPILLRATGMEVVPCRMCQDGNAGGLGNAIVYCVPLVDNYGNRIADTSDLALQVMTGDSRLRTERLISTSAYFGVYWFQPIVDGVHSCALYCGERRCHSSELSVKICGPENPWIIPSIKRFPSSERSASIDRETTASGANAAFDRIARIVLCQALVRSWLAKQRAARLRVERERNIMAGKIQRSFRYYFWLRQRCKAALAIQRVARGRMGRKRAQNAHLARLRGNSALTIQRCWRGMVGRKHALEEFLAKTRSALALAFVSARIVEGAERATIHFAELQNSATVEFAIAFTESILSRSLAAVSTHHAAVKVNAPRDNADGLSKVEEASRVDEVPKNIRLIEKSASSVPDPVVFNQDSSLARDAAVNAAPDTKDSDSFKNVAFSPRGEELFGKRRDSDCKYDPHAMFLDAAMKVAKDAAAKAIHSGVSIVSRSRRLARVEQAKLISKSMSTFACHRALTKMRRIGLRLPQIDVAAARGMQSGVLLSFRDLWDASDEDSARTLSFRSVFNDSDGSDILLSFRDLWSEAGSDEGDDHTAADTFEELFGY